MLEQPMAEFKLGRIRFIWKDEWSSSTTYYKDDVIRYGGKTFICVLGHISQTDFMLDLTNPAAKWQQFSDGQSWQNDWQVLTSYKINDVVKYGSQLYICNTGHISGASITAGLEEDQSKWDLFAEGFDYLGDWTIDTRYKINDIVKYGAKVYLCVAPHTSAADTVDGLELDQSSWDTFSNGFDWKTDWTVSTRYRVGDLVKFGGTVYSCNTGHTSAATEALGLEADQAKWDYFHKGIEFKAQWLANTRYKINDVVKDSGGLWICTTYHTSGPNDTLRQDEANWAVFVAGLEFEDTWQAYSEYQPGDFVTYGGYTYVSTTNNIEKPPALNASDWDVFITGFNLKGDYADDSTNQDYLTGDVVRLGGWTYLAIANSNGVRPPNAAYWEKLNEGAYWKDAWADAAYYDKGDVVSHGVNSYICILEHTADENPVGGNNRPDQDVTGTYWNFFSGGAEVGNLTTVGDLVYYSGAGPTRLPVGQPGQVLVVNNTRTAPEWTYFGFTNHVYYVETENGVDERSPLRGITLDRPFKSIRYALAQIERGAAFADSRHLLEINRSFIQSEVVEWVNYQIANPTGIWAGFTNSDIDKCRRDIGQILDAIAWDISHGGNERTRLATLSYFSSGTLIPAIADEEEQLAEALVYMLEVVDAVISNQPPAANYQTLNAVGSPITQLTPAEFNEEAEIQAIINSLVSIITTALLAGVSSGIPREVRANKTVFVKTGRYNEVLPMVVPKDVAIVGDELRSTKIAPAGTLVDSADVTYSLAALTRIKDIISDLVSAPATVVKTAGNLLDPVDTRPVGSVGSSAAVASVTANATEIAEIVETGVSSADALVFTNTGVTSKTTARTELQTNRASIISDLIAWITSNYPALVYDQALCERDTGYIVDAISYDIQYGSNWASVVAASAYYSGAVAILPVGQTTETAAALGQLKTIVNTYLSGATEEIEAGVLIDIVIDVVNNGTGGLPTISYPDITWAAADLQLANAALLAARSQIQLDGLQYVKSTFPTLLFNEATCSRDVGYIVDGLAYDLALGSNYQSIISGLAYYRGSASAQLVLANQKDATVGIINFIKFKAKHAAAAGAGAAAEALFGDIINYIGFQINAAGEAVISNGANTPKTSTEFTYAVETLEANKSFLVAEVHAYIADTYPGYTYSMAACARDVLEYIEAVKYDLVYTGNYKSVYAARHYVNAVAGSALEDMFYMRNGTGLRNCTVSDLIGGLSSINEYGTKRPAAGSFVSLDPGWGPNHTEAWIINKSPYVQNVSTFGTGCVGMKVDGSLHNGGNDSIVANDFTQILSGGIGAWVTNLGRAELVSVFSYYNHIGYLAENGGKIRATNGNNSYGDFGSVAEGIDVTETPITGEVDNEQLEAQISFVHTDGSDEILQLEYLNAGQDYTTEATTAILTVNTLSSSDVSRVEGTYKNIVGTSAGSGTGQEFTVTVESSGSFSVEVTKGGTGHAPTDLITVSDSLLGGGGAADASFRVATIGAATVFGITGEGFGAVIDTVVVRDGGVFEVQLDDPAENYGGDGYLQASSNSQAGNATQITLAATDVAATGAYNGMSIYINSGLGKGQYGYIDTYDAGSKLATVLKESDGLAGWDSIKGDTIASVLDSTTAYVISPRVVFSDPPSGITARGRARVADEKIVEIRIIEPGSGYVTVPTMTLVDPNNVVDVPHTVRIGDGVLAQPTWTNRGTGFITASAVVSGDGYSNIRQFGTKIRVDNLTTIPQKGSNVEFASLPNRWFKLVTITNLLGNGPYSALLQVSPKLAASERPAQDDLITIRRRFSQVRLTGHDFLDIGTGDFENTNYPDDPLTEPTPSTETNDFGGGRVFYTSTDQDGNFRVGGLFNVEQATGIATLNVEAFNISGLNELQLGSVALGSAGAVVSEFSTDGTFSADSDSVVPTQKAIKTYITSQIGGGVATLNVNSMTAGVIEITGNQISTTSGGRININNVMNFQGGIDGAPVALQMFLLN
jgi:hypothetical protein